MIHYQFRKGKKVIVILKNGKKVIDKYVGYTSKYLILEKNSIEFERIRSATIYKKGYCINEGGE